MCKVEKNSEMGTQSREQLLEEYQGLGYTPEELRSIVSAFNMIADICGTDVGAVAELLMNLKHVEAENEALRSFIATKWRTSSR